MIGVIIAMMSGDASMIDKFAEAKRFWDEFFKAHKDDDVKALALALDNAQFRHEGIFGDRYLGKSTMPYTCLGSLWDEAAGFRDRDLAERVVRAFEGGLCSIEVKHAASKAAALFRLV